MKMNKIFPFPRLVLSVIAILTLSWAPANPVNEIDSKTATNEIANKHSNLSPLSLLENQASTIYDAIHLENAGLSFEVFEKAYIGFLNLQTSHKVSEQSSILSIADFNQSSKNKRLWIIDLKNESLLLNTWVSHGRGSGGDIATQFSNTNNSHQSSLGFYVTGEVYSGKHGRSLRLDGMDNGFNSNARSRAIVLHGASYVSPQAIKNLNRLGLSHGCPAVPLELSNKIIDLVKNKTVLYIHANSKGYHSVYLNPEVAGKRLLASIDNTDQDQPLDSHIGI